MTKLNDQHIAETLQAYVDTVGGDNTVIETLDVMEFNDDGLIVRMTAYWGDSLGHRKG